MKKILLLLAGIITAGLLYVDLSNDNFRDKVGREVGHLLRAAGETARRTEADSGMKRLPAPVRRYLDFALQGTRPDIATAVIKQTGEFRARETSGWVPLQAQQHSAVKFPAFVWHARISPTPYTWIEARDRYYDGAAIMEGRLLSAVPLLFAHGKEMNISSLSRYLAEAPWYPPALLPGKNLVWKAIDKDSAEAVLTADGYIVSVVFTFNEKGEVIGASTTDRYRNINGNMEKTRWTASYREYQKMEGLMLPTEVDVSWETPKGPFQYARVKVSELRYNKP